MKKIMNVKLEIKNSKNISSKREELIQEFSKKLEVN
jgi:hypothetical protein